MNNINHEKKKIAFVIQNLEKGGAERVVVRLANHMADQLCLDVTIIVFDKAEKAEWYVPSEAVFIHDLEINAKYYLTSLYKKMFLFLKQIRELKRYFQKEKFDRIFSFMESANMPAILTGFPVVVSSRSSLNRCGGKFYSKLFFLYNRHNVERVIALTSAMKEAFSKRKIYNTTVIRNPVDEKERNYSCENAVHFNKNQPYFLAVGRLHSVKNFEFLIKSFSHANCSKKFSLLIVGDGEQRLFLEKLIEQLQLAESVKLLGICCDVELHCLYTNAYATVLSSISEGFPNVLIESLSKGTPVIATDCPDGPSEIVQPGKNGFLVPVNDASLFCDTLDLLASDNSLREKLAAYAQESVVHLSIDKIAKQWLSV
ncbi:MAG: glycosyltransferase [Gammaproteobacteria bacterium]|nr:glycosyltransferase [Gammaproteobacteria bacterium]